jgi:hypothetical protein
MVSRLISWRFGRPRRRLSRSRGLATWSPTSAVECLEERTLLSASLALYNGSYAGTYKGTETVNNNGQISTSTQSPAAVQASIVNGVVSVSIGGGTGTGIVGSNGSLSGTVNTTVNGQAVAVSFTGSVTAASNSTSQIAGTWSFSTNLGGGVTVTGQGTWSAASAVVVTDFDGNYNGSYQGSLSVNNNGAVSTSAVSPTAFQTANANGAISDAFAAGSPLSNGIGTINALGAINGSVTYTQNGLPITVTDSGQATRSASGVVESGTWTFSVNLGGGVTETGSGTWSAQSVLSFNGSYAGTFNGSTTLNNNGTISTTAIPNEVNNLSVAVTVTNGAVSVSAPGVPASGTGTINQNGNITGTFTFTEDGVQITGQFTGQVVVTPNGNVITGTWSFSENFGGGIVYSGSGTWNADSPPTV